jgi:uncharacterized membrane protein
MNLFIVIALIVLLVVFLKVKHMNQRLSAIIIVVLLLFFYVSYSKVTEDQEIDYKSASGVEKGARLYFTWLGNLFDNFRTITGNAINMDWTGNETKNIEK